MACKIDIRLHSLLLSLSTFTEQESSDVFFYRMTGHASFDSTSDFVVAVAQIHVFDTLHTA